ncbi:MAG TPA: pyrrolo-quinoline quinone [Verrucomicrobiae bacterium]|nr:pyrrolo-quinoline quinone [Verrucomicrobiae bacterium]
MKTSFKRKPEILHGTVLLLATFWLQAAQAANVLTQHNDISRTGANTSETILTPANVNAANFGKLFANAVDGQMYAQPLYVQNLGISGGIHNVVFACTESNSVYAFDADTAGVTYWHTNLGTPFPAPCGDLMPNIGITSTPVIDLKSGTMYLDTKLAAGPAHKLHALDITNGHEKFGGPMTIAAGSQFSASLEHQRAGLLLLNGVVYLAFASHCDGGAYHGFLLGYNATNLTQTATFNTTPGGSQGGIWSGGAAPAADANGSIYIMVGNGTFDGINNYGESMIKLSGSLVVQDYATPADWSSLNSGDTDFGSGGPVLLPTHYAVGMGKDGNLYLADTTGMGHVGAFAQQFPAQSGGDTIGPSPVYWQGPTQQLVFALHSNSKTKAFAFSGTNFNTTPSGTAAFSFSDRVGGISLSANGATNGVLWEIGDDSILRAYDAANFPTSIWAGSIGTYVKMTCPTIANGKVYVGTSANLGVWGLTNFIYTQIGAPNPVFNWAAGTLLESTNVTGPWVTNSAASPYMVTPTNTQKFYRLLLKSGP